MGESWGAQEPLGSPEIKHWLVKGSLADVEDGSWNQLLRVIQRLPVKLIQENHLEIVGRGPILLSSPPSPDRSGDLYTGRIVEEAALLSRAHAIVAKEPKATSESSTLGQIASDFDSITQRLIEELGIKCIIVIRGKAEQGIEIRTSQASNENPVTAEFVIDKLAADFELKTSLDGEGLQTHQTKVQTFQLEIGPDERGFRKDLFVSRIADLIGLVTGKLGWSEADQGTRDVHD